MKSLILSLLLASIPLPTLALDPRSLHPAHLSLLSVLRTALPANDLTLPTDTDTPQWYLDLPSDAKALLPRLYPATPLVSDSTPVITAAAADANANAAVTTATAAADDTTSTTTEISTSQTTMLLTKTVRRPSSSSTGVAPAESDAAAATATARSSAGAKSAGGLEMWAAVWGFGVGIGFFVFA